MSYDGVSSRFLLSTDRFTGVLPIQYFYDRKEELILSHRLWKFFPGEGGKRIHLGKKVIDFSSDYINNSEVWSYGE